MIKKDWLQDVATRHYLLTSGLVSQIRSLESTHEGNCRRYAMLVMLSCRQLTVCQLNIHASTVLAYDYRFNSLTLPLFGGITFYLFTIFPRLILQGNGAYFTPPPLSRTTHLALARAIVSDTIPRSKGVGPYTSLLRDC